MTEILSSANENLFETERDEFLSTNNELGFEPKNDKKEKARILAEDAFKLISKQMPEEQNID
jgi:hypothetical protein